MRDNIMLGKHVKNKQMCLVYKGDSIIDRNKNHYLVNQSIIIRIVLNLENIEFMKMKFYRCLKMRSCLKDL